MNHLEVFPSSFYEQIQTLIDFLSPYTKRAYFVGGCVRDIFLKRAIKDIDIEIYDIEPKLFDELMQSLGATGVGKSFFVYKWRELDLALPRVERKVSVGHAGFEVALINDEKEASKRRDFSMNALMMNIFNGEVLDFWDGQKAIENHLIKHIDKKSFIEDSLRVLRAVQFASRFDFSIESQTIELMKTVSLEDLSATRVFWELEKFFKAEFLHVGAFYFYELNLFEKIFSLHVKKEEIEKIIKICKNMDKLKECQEYYFIYICAGVLKIPSENLLNHLELPKKYLNTFKYQPYFDKIPSSKELLEIAMQLPIKNWLGNYQKEVQELAKKLDVFEKIYDGGIDIQDVIKDGFCGPAIKEEYIKRVKETIRKREENA